MSMLGRLGAFFRRTSGPITPPALEVHRALGAPVVATAALAALEQERAATLRDAGPATVELKIYQEPSTRSFIVWTPEQVRNTVRLADAGTLLYAADLCDAMLGDDRIPAVLATRANALLGSDISFEDGSGKAARRAKRALEAEEDWWAAFPEEELSRLLIWGVLLGVGVAQIEWSLASDAAGARLIPRIRVWHPRFLRWDWYSRQWFLRVGESLDEIPITPGDGKWILFTPYGASRPWSFGLWRGLALLWLMKVYATLDWAQHSEVHGNPIRLGTIPAVNDKEIHKGTKTVRVDLANDLANLGKNSTLVLPTGFNFALVEATARTWQMFQAQIALANTSASIMAIGTNLPTEVAGPAKTGATAQTLVRDDYKKRDGETLSTCLHNQATVYWARFNFGSDEAAPWGVWQTDPPVDRAALATTFSTIATALLNLNEAGYVPDLEQVDEDFGFKLTLAAPVEPAALPPGAPPQKPPQLPAAAARAQLGARPPGSPHRAMRAGQEMADAVAEATRARAVKALGPLLADVERAVRRARAAPDPKATLRGEIKALAAKAPPEDFARLIEHATLLGVATGAWAQTQTS